MTSFAPRIRAVAPRRPALCAHRLLLVLVLWCRPATAHDFWLEPSTYTPAPGAVVGLRLRVGQHFLGDALPRDPELLRRFVAAAADGETPVPGVAGTDPAGLLRPSGRTGVVIVAYESGPSVAELPPAKVARYFAEEGLDRAAAGSTAPSVSSWSWCRKRTPMPCRGAAACRCACSPTVSRWRAPSSPPSHASTPWTW